MAIGELITVDEDGVVLIGAVELKNVATVTVTPSVEEEETVIAMWGGKKTIYSDSQVSLDCVIELYDADGVTATLRAFRVGNVATGKNQTITIRPQGTGAGLDEWILNPAENGMNLVTKPWVGAASENGTEPVSGTMTWRGIFDEEPAWAEQS